MSAQDPKDVVNLNADNLDAGELDDKALEEAAGGAGGLAGDCGTFRCEVYSVGDEQLT
jgi:hypothetical protein